MTTFRQLLDQFEESAKTRSAKGRVFERFCEAFFRTDPLWSERFDAVWSWSDWPERGNRGDTGIDLVAREAGTDRLVAIQCKFYSPDAVLSWGHVATFAGMLAQPEFAEGMIVSTAGAESSNVHTNLQRHPKRVVFWRVDDFEESRVDWSQFRIDRPAELALRDPKALRPHQETAIGAVAEKFDLHERGQLIMACGTGKTFTSLRLAEQLVDAGGSVLFLVPSINLLSQAVLAWANDAVVPLASFAVCSDTKAGVRTSEEDMSVNDLAFPASTDAAALVEQIQSRAVPGHMTAVFSTYQSIDVITQAQQEHGLGEFDLIICDEAHRTTGAFKETGEQSPFTKVHDDAFVRGARRLYMTATPRIYGDQTKAKAAKSDVIVASMDDEACFGPVFHELRFGDAVAQKLLTDYKVLVLAVNEDAVSAAFQRQFETTDGELALDDMAKIVGCWHGLSKRGPQFADDNMPIEVVVRTVDGAPHIEVNVGGEIQLVRLTDPKLERRKNKTGFRFYGVYRTPHDARVPKGLRGDTLRLRLHTNDEDKQRRLNRAEVLRPITVDDERWNKLSSGRANGRVDQRVVQEPLAKQARSSSRKEPSAPPALIRSDGAEHPCVARLRASHQAPPRRPTDADRGLR